MIVRSSVATFTYPSYAHSVSPTVSPPSSLLFAFEMIHFLLKHTTMSGKYFSPSVLRLFSSSMILSSPYRIYRHNSRDVVVPWSTVTCQPLPYLESCGWRKLVCIRLFPGDFRQRLSLSDAVAQFFLETAATRSREIKPTRLEKELGGEHFRNFVEILFKGQAVAFCQNS